MVKVTIEKRCGCFTREGLEAKRMIDQLLSERIKEAKIEVLEKVLEKKTN